MHFNDKKYNSSSNQEKIESLVIVIKLRDKRHYSRKKIAFVFFRNFNWMQYEVIFFCNLKKSEKIFIFLNV
jgi:hypothetical protein